jgi:hypothetical protein
MNGAIDTAGNYVLPTYANKGQEYTCPDSHCRRKVFVRRGEVNRPHFCHYADEVPCRFYDGHGESAEHKNGKLILRNILEQKRDIRILRRCWNCPSTVDYVVPKDITDIREEYPIGSNRRADVGCKLSGGSMLIFEVFHTSATWEANRSGTWFELKTQHIFDQYSPTGPLVFQCSRSVRCESCEKEHIREAENARVLAEQRRKEYCMKLEREQEDHRNEQKRRKEQFEHDAEQKRIQMEIQKREYEETQRKWKIAEDIRIADYKEKQRLDAIRIAEAHKVYQAKLDEERRLHQMELDKAETQKREQEILYDLTHKDYLRELVDTHVYDPNLRDPPSILYKGFEFLHPNDVCRLRLKLKRTR